MCLCYTHLKSRVHRSERNSRFKSMGPRISHYMILYIPWHAMLSISVIVLYNLSGENLISEVRDVPDISCRRRDK